MWSRKREWCFVLGIVLLCLFTLKVTANATDSRELPDQDSLVDPLSFSDHETFKQSRKRPHCFGGRCVQRKEVKYLGNVCWDVSIPSLGDNPGSMKLGITHMGGGHFVLNGLLGAIEEGEGKVEFSLVRGNSELVEDKRRLSLDNTTAEVFDDPFLGNDLQGNGGVIFNLFLDPKTLDGSGFGGGVQMGNLDDLNFIGFLGEVSVKKISCKNVIWRR